MVDTITQECKRKFEAHETFLKKSCEIWRNLLTNQYGISNLHLESGFLYDEEAKDYKPTFEFIVLGEKDRENFERFRKDLENSGFNLYDKNLGTIALSDLDEVVYIMQLMRQAGFSIPLAPYEGTVNFTQPPSEGGGLQHGTTIQDLAIELQPASTGGVAVERRQNIISRQLH
ncbi:MAG: hypothetical protein MRY79_03380 [Alphaproteobacteria bacterium]|nr:hypothetical protein [Alphaproteobacteria bacterium]